MMRLKIKFLFAIILQATIVFAQSSELETCMQGMNELLTKHKTFSTDWTISYYSPEGDLLSEEDGEIFIEGEKYYRKSDGNISIQNLKNALLVNHHQRYIRVLDRSKNDSYDTPDLMALNDSLFQNDSVKLLKSGNNVMISADGTGVYDSISMVVDTKEYYPVSMTYLIKNKDFETTGFSKIEIRYTNTKLDKKIDQKLFSIKRFLKKHSGQYVSLLEGYNVYGDNTYEL